jgi:hypothetical protein
MRFNHTNDFDFINQVNATPSERYLSMVWNGTNNGIRHYHGITSGSMLTPFTDNGINQNDSMGLGSASFEWFNLSYSGSIITTSGRQFKNDIEDNVLGLDFVNKLRPVEFKFKDYEDVYTKEQDGFDCIIQQRYPHKQFGFIAQDVEQVLSEFNETDMIIAKEHIKHKNPLLLDNYKYTIKMVELIPILSQSLIEISNELDKIKHKKQK